MLLEKIVTFIIRNIIKLKWLFIGLLLLGIILTGFFLKNINTDNSLDIWFVENDQVLKNYKYFQKTFGNDEIITILISDNKSMLEKNNKDFLKKLIYKIEKIENVKKVYSFFTPIKKKYFLSKDNKHSILYIELNSIENIDKDRPKIISDLKKVLINNFQSNNKKYSIAGIGIVYDALNQITLIDSTIFISLSYILILLFLCIFLQRIKFIIISIIIILYSVIFVMGVFCFFNKSLNMVTMILPTLIIIFSLADSIHMINTYIAFSKKNPDLEKKETIIKSLTQNFIPCFLTSLTTGIGFLSLTLSKIRIIKDLGIFACTGVMLEFFITILIIPILFSLFPKPSFKVKSKTNFFIKSINLINKKIDTFNFYTKLSSLILKYNKIIIITALLLVLTSIFGIFMIKVDTFSLNFLKKNHIVRQDSDYIEKNFGYYTPIEFVLKSKKGAFLEPDKLKTADEFIKKIEKQNNIINIISITTFIPNVNILRDRAHVIQTFKIFKPFEEDIKKFINMDHSEIRITGRIKMTSATGFDEIIKKTLNNRYILYKNDIDIYASGYIPLYIKMMQYITETQILSFITAFIIIFIIVSLYAFSFRLSMFSILVNLFPLSLTLGFMGFVRIRLDIATVTISAIAIGIVVDDTIHFLYKFKKILKNNTYENSLKKTLSETGKSIIFTSLILTFGFSVLLFASVKSIIFFGLLSCMVIMLALISDLLILPSLIILFKKGKNNAKK